MFSQPFPGEELTCTGAATASVRSCKNSFSLEPEAFIQHKHCWPEAEFLVAIQTKVLRVFLLVIHNRLLPGDFHILKLTQPLTVSVKEKGGKPDRKP
jgi:hypothetical protein